MTLSGIGELPLFNRRSSGTEEIEALLDLLPHPTLIVDGRRGRVLFANAQATQLTAYTRREYSELEIGALLPQFPIDQLEKNSNEQNTLSLVTRSSRSMHIKVKTENLGGPNHWVAVSLMPIVEHEENNEAIVQQRWEAIHVLALAAQQNDLLSTYRQILQAGRLLTGSSHLALYLPSGKDGTLGLNSMFGDAIEFPDHLSDLDLSRLRTPKIWQTGKPIEASLHKLANSNKLSYLATSPLDITNPNAGLLVVADTAKHPPKNLGNFLQILAAVTSTASIHAQMTSDLHEQIKRLGSMEELKAALQDHVLDGLLFADETFNILDLNPAAESMLGYTVSEVRGRAANDILVGANSLLPAMEQALQQGTAHDVGERKIHKRDGSEFLASLRVIPIHAESSPKVVVIFSDLSEHQAFHLQNQQLQQRAAIGEITAIFAHEVRNPINSISTGLQLMQMNLPEQDPLQEQIKKLQEDVDRLEHRMKSVDAFSRNLEPHPESLDLGEFCRTQLDRWRPRMNRKHITDHIQVAADVPHILGDRRALDQVLTNLITNAIQAMEGQEEGILAIKIRKNPDDPATVDLHLSDTGPGIPEDIRKRIFEPFFTTKGQEGTGLGLAITRRIVMAHRGKIECESFPGGTLFKIQLPVTPTDTAEGTPT